MPPLGVTETTSTLEVTPTIPTTIPIPTKTIEEVPAIINAVDDAVLKHKDTVVPSK